jgi:hypothetical protein
MRTLKRDKCTDNGGGPAPVRSLHKGAVMPFLETRVRMVSTVYRSYRLSELRREYCLARVFLYVPRSISLTILTVNTCMSIGT